MTSPDKPTLDFFLRKDIFFILFLWLVLTLINIDKAFHIDDTFHLQAAGWIMENPSTPMSGLINWADDPTPMFTHNQPVLFFYLIAFTSFLFGMNEIPLHLMESVFTFLALFYFYKTAVLIKVKKPRILLSFLAFCPAFIVNQNVMVDVPVLSLILISSYHLISARKEKKLLHYTVSALCIGTGLLIKYSLLPLVVVILLVLLIRRDFRFLPVLLIPVVFITAWSFWNISEFGLIHIFNRPAGKFRPVRVPELVACLGATSPISLCLIPRNFSASRWLLTYFVFVTIAYIVLVSTGLIHFSIFGESLNYLFFVNGLLLVTAVSSDLYKHYNSGDSESFIHSNDFVLWLIAGSMAGFMVLFAPFMATRHLLLIIPFILLLCGPLIEQAGKPLMVTALTLTIVLGLLLGISDWKTADYYRKMAGNIQVSEKHTVWAAGHWGWQWYAVKNGMKTYGMETSAVKNGDYLVFPRDIQRQTIAPNLSLTPVSKEWQDANLFTFFSGSRLASLYSSSIHNPVWRFSTSPVDTVYVFRVELSKP